METSELNFDSRSAQRAYKWLFTMASRYSGKDNAGPIGSGKKLNKYAERASLIPIISFDFAIPNIDEAINEVIFDVHMEDNGAFFQDREANLLDNSINEVVFDIRSQRNGIVLVTTDPFAYDGPIERQDNSSNEVLFGFSLEPNNATFINYNLENNENAVNMVIDFNIQLTRNNITL